VTFFDQLLIFFVFLQAYSDVTDFVRSGLHKWARDGKPFEKYGPYIELITSPNNPNGIIREPVVSGDLGKLIYYLAYYWPQYTAITSPANHDVMLFTISKYTGHVGSRTGQVFQTLITSEITITKL